MSTSDRARRIAERLKGRLAEIEFPLEEMDRRLGWKEGRTASVLRRGEGLRMSDLLRMLEAAGFEEKAFFADLYDLSPKESGAGEEIPYSSGLQSDEDAAEFPPANEVLGLFRMLVQEGLREDLREGGSGSVTGSDFPEDRPPTGSRTRKRY